MTHGGFKFWNVNCVPEFCLYAVSSNGTLDLRIHSFTKTFLRAIGNWHLTFTQSCHMPPQQQHAHNLMAEYRTAPALAAIMHYPLWWVSAAQQLGLAWSMDNFPSFHDWLRRICAQEMDAWRRRWRAWAATVRGIDWMHETWELAWYLSIAVLPRVAILPPSLLVSALVQVRSMALLRATIALCKTHDPHSCMFGPVCSSSLSRLI
jgi:hypothetical protein